MEGTTVLHYEIEELLGRGAMGTVYKALDTRLDTYRALKFLHPSLSDLKFAQDHLLREARTQAKLFHPNVAALLELEITDEWTFLVMEYVDGPTLDVYLAESKPPLKERFNLLLQIACALDAAHSHEILHRDIKPKNVLIASDGTAKVTDFGLAKTLGQTTLTMSGETKGTAPYMAPEAFRGDKISKASDVWSLGVLAYEVLEKELPFMGDNFEAIAYQIVNESPPSLSNKVQKTLPSISEFLDACLNKYEKERPADGSEAFLALTGIAANAGLSSSVPALSIPRIHRRKRARLFHRRAAIALLGIAIIAGAILSRSIHSTQYVELGNLPPIRGDVAATWDKAGKRLALIMETGTSGLYILDTDKEHAEPEPIPLNTQATFEHLRWSPNDSIIALAGAGGLYLYDIAREELQQIVYQRVNRLSWSGDSRWIVYAPEIGGALKRIGPFQPFSDSLHITTPEHLEITGLDHLGESIRLHDPIYILDYTRIAFRIERIAEHLGIYTIPAEGGEAKPLIGRDLYPSLLDWNEKKRELFFYSSGEKPDIYRVKVKKGGTESGRMRALRIGEGVADFDFHPETGKVVVLTAWANQQIWEIPINADGDSTVRVIPDGFCPSLSYDGRELFYVTASSERGVQLRVRELSSGLDNDLVTYNPRIKHECYPTPSPNGRYIVFRAFSDNYDDLWLYDRNRLDLKQLTFDSAVETDPSWAADGGSIYYEWDPNDGTSPHQIRQLLLNRVNGGIEAGTVRIRHSGGSMKCPQSSEDDQYLLFEEKEIIYMIGPTGAKSTLIQGSYPALSPSRRDVYYYRENRILRIEDWIHFSSEPRDEQIVSLLPSDIKVIYNGPPLTIGHFTVFALLMERDVSDLKVLLPNR